MLFVLLRAQVSQLIDFMRSKEGVDEPVYLMGDLNINALTAEGQESEEYQAFILQLEEWFEVTDIMKEKLGRHPVTCCDTVEGPDGALLPRETVLTGTHEHCRRESLDYILLLFPKQAGETADGTKPPGDADGCSPDARLPHRRLMQMRRLPSMASFGSSFTEDDSLLEGAGEGCLLRREPSVDLYNAFLAVDTRRGGVAVLDARVEEFFITGRVYTQISDHYGLGMDVQVELPSEEAAYVAEWVWENQRSKMLVGNFGGEGCLLSTDRAAFCSIDDIETLRPLDDRLPDETWEWVDAWQAPHFPFPVASPPQCPSRHVRSTSGTQRTPRVGSMPSTSPPRTARPQAR